MAVSVVWPSHGLYSKANTLSSLICIRKVKVKYSVSLINPQLEYQHDSRIFALIRIVPK